MTNLPRTQATVGVAFGALAPPLHEQLGLPPATVCMEQKWANHVTGLLIAGILTDAEGSRARRRIMKRLLSKVHPAQEDSDKQGRTA